MGTARVGILGSGEVGRALAAGFARHGYDVRIGTRDPAKIEEWRRALPTPMSVGSFEETARHAEIAVLATLGTGTEAALRLAGPPHLAGKLLLDATNPLDFSKGMPPGLFVGLTDSLGELVQRTAPEAKVVKCFNTVPNSQMIDPKFSEPAPAMLICGNDAVAKQRVDALMTEFGWAGGLDVGTIEAARWLEALVPLWVRAGVALGTFGHVFKVVR